MGYSFRQELILLDNEIAFNEAMIEERDQGIREIEEQIGQANEIFRDLAVLVHEQGVIIGKMLTKRWSCFLGKKFSHFISQHCLLFYTV